MTASHLAGPVAADAARIAEIADGFGWASTLAYWTAPADTPATVAPSYTAALDIIRGKPLNAYLSIKVTAIEYDFGILKDLLDRAADGGNGIRIHFDAMDPASASPTFELLERALKVSRNLGCTLPARWRRSVHDARRVAELGIPVRVVKGQWPDPVSPVPDLRAGYLQVVRELAGKAAHVAVATHDIALARKALGILKSGGTSCEMEQLSSLPQNCARLARELAIPFRIYVPFGYPSMPYDIWQVRTRPQIIGWVLRDALAGKHRTLSTID